VRKLNIRSFDTGYPIHFETLRDEVGDDVEIAGGVPVPLLMTGRPDEVARETERILTSGILRGVIKNRVECVLAGSIRDDGPLPGVIGNVYEAQDKMRTIAKRATTVIALATQLHTIATGNLVPSYRVIGKNRVRPVFFYTVDMSEFAANKLANRGSLTAHSILTNVQDFVVTVKRGLMRKDRGARR
jgi:hypothetical protein